MKIISFKNPLPKEVTDMFDKYCNKEVECSCGTIFKADVSDVYIAKANHMRNDDHTYRLLVNCPICNEQHCIGLYHFCEEDVNNFKEYQNYLRNKVKFEKLKGEDPSWIGQ